MAERKSPSSRPVSGEPSGSPAPKDSTPPTAASESATSPDRGERSGGKPKGKIAKRAGGHTVYVDPPSKTVVTGQCSVHGVALVDGKCPEPHESRGWVVGKGK